MILLFIRSLHFCNWNSLFYTARSVHHLKEINFVFSLLYTEHRYFLFKFLSSMKLNFIAYVHWDKRAIRSVQYSVCNCLVHHCCHYDYVYLESKKKKPLMAIIRHTHTLNIPFILLHFRIVCCVHIKILKCYFMHTTRSIHMHT